MGGLKPHQKRRRSDRVKPLLPSLLTTGSLAFGILSIMYSIQAVSMQSAGEAAPELLYKKFWWASVFICFAGLFDFLDGSFARLLKTESEFGVSLDSLSDIVSFGVAPGILVYAWTLMDAGKLGAMCVLLYIVCSALRLARFNIQSGDAEGFKFMGLPSPAGAALMLTPIMLLSDYSIPSNEIAKWFYLFAAPFFGLLMVSDVRYSKGGKFLFRRSFDNLVIAAVVIAASVANTEVVFLVLAYTYFIYSLGTYMLRHVKRAFRKKKSESIDDVGEA